MFRKVEKENVSLNLGGELISLDRPLVMGILNITPDSFYAHSRALHDEEMVRRLHTLVNEGADIIDVGAYSTRPGAEDISPDEEMARLSQALELIGRHYPEVKVSVDTFRAEIATRCVQEYGVQMINDISGGELDNRMFETVADLHVPYVLTHLRGTLQTMSHPTHQHHLIPEMLYYFSERIDRLRRLGVNDIIIDPGFGFGKTLDDNYLLLNRLDEFARIGLPLLAGISRKSMIYKQLNTTPEESLNGTTVLHTLALLNGANILRTHDVKEAKESINLVCKTLQSNP